MSAEKKVKRKKVPQLTTMDNTIPRNKVVQALVPIALFVAGAGLIAERIYLQSETVSYSTENTVLLLNGIVFTIAGLVCLWIKKSNTEYRRDQFHVMIVFCFVIGIFCILWVIPYAHIYEHLFKIKTAYSRFFI